MLTNKAKYGVKAVVYLAGLPPGETALIADIAARNNIPKKFLDAILLELRNAGLVRSRKGPGGGYALARSAREIKVGEVIRALDGPLVPLACANAETAVSCEDCATMAVCPVRMVMSEVNDAVSAILDRTSLSALVAQTPVPRRRDAWAYEI
ncbi:Rrf2 family transcriptional regulator [Rhodovastum atsumiense]|uniref:Rrf2 family transcriptional regulator n=1 Tax=Rhodovastum atsumiense TaxID=504468 RepID=A0A5M6IZV2_9PROT|nr:Rrf2 family transcriptional regulator [Rhodovastum atsumiense]KAA5613833.1 Rrf2 family transcriptional regulator [Rhodovastum atsumiense]CAH2601942.1 Rrf2 family transcriptional regulator [Rhodovastum atsumiense]